MHKDRECSLSCGSTKTGRQLVLDWAKTDSCLPMTQILKCRMRVCRPCFRESLDFIPCFALTKNNLLEIRLRYLLNVKNHTYVVAFISNWLLALSSKALNWRFYSASHTWSEEWRLLSSSFRIHTITSFFE